MSPPNDTKKTLTKITQFDEDPVDAYKPTIAMMDKNNNDDDKEEEEYVAECGIGGFKPASLRMCASMAVFTGVYSFSGLLTSTLSSYVNSQVTIFFYTSTKSWRDFIFTAVLFVYVCVCVSACLSVNKTQPKRCTDLDAVFTKWLLTTLAQTLLKLVFLGQRSRSHVTFIFFPS